MMDRPVFWFLVFLFVFFKPKCIFSYHDFICMQQTKVVQIYANVILQFVKVEVSVCCCSSVIFRCVL